MLVGGGNAIGKKSVPAKRSAGFVIESMERRTLLSAGALDTTFGVGGRVQTTLTGAGLDQWNAAVVNRRR
jgi:hypothetical protein